MKTLRDKIVTIFHSNVSCFIYNSNSTYKSRRVIDKVAKVRFETFWHLSECIYNEMKIR